MRLKKLPAAVFALCIAAPLLALLRADATPAATQAASSFAPDDSTAMRCSNRNAAGTGLRGDYFAAADMKGAPLLSRVDATIEFDASLDWPADKGRDLPRSARWQGWIKAPLSGRYRFHADPGMRITVSGLPMAGGEAPADAGLELTLGSFYPIVMEADLSGLNRVSLEWTAPHGVRYVIPRALLFLPMS